MDHTKAKRLPVTGRQALAKIDGNRLLDDDNDTPPAPALQHLRASWLRRRGVGEPVVMLVASLAFSDKGAR